MRVSFRHTRTGLLALAAAGLFAAGTVADRANRLHAADTAQRESATEPVRLANDNPHHSEARVQ